MSYQQRVSQAQAGYSGMSNEFSSRTNEYDNLEKHLDDLNAIAIQKNNFDITHPLEAGGGIEGGLIGLKGIQKVALGTAEKPTTLGSFIGKIGEKFDNSKFNVLNAEKRMGWSKNLRARASVMRDQAKDVRFKGGWREAQKLTGKGKFDHLTGKGVVEEGEEFGKGRPSTNEQFSSRDFLGKGQSPQEQQNQAIDALRTKMRGQSGFREDEGGVDGLFSGETGGSYRGDDTREGDFDDARQDFKYDPDEAFIKRFNTEQDAGELGKTAVNDEFNEATKSVLKVKSKPWMRAQPAPDKNPADFEADQTATPEIAEARETLGLNRATVLKSTRETGGMGGEDFDAVEPPNRVVDLGADTDAISGSVNSGGGGVGTTVRIFKAGAGGRAGATVGRETTGEAEEASSMGEELSSRVGGFATNVRNIGSSLVEEGGRLKQNLGDVGGKINQSMGAFVERQKASFKAGQNIGTGTVEDATEGGADVADTIIDAGAGVGTAAEAGGLEATAAGLEVAGDALDATGVGAVLGVALNVGGLVAAGYGAYEGGKGVLSFIKQDVMGEGDAKQQSPAKAMISMAQKGLSVVPTFDTARSITQTSNSW